jgi:hypothetical protein
MSLQESNYVDVSPFASFPSIVVIVVGFFSTGGMTKFAVDIKHLTEKQMWVVKPCVWHLQFCGNIEGFIGCGITVLPTSFQF